MNQCESAILDRMVNLLSLVPSLREDFWDKFNDEETNSIISQIRANSTEVLKHISAWDEKRCSEEILKIKEFSKIMDQSKIEQAKLQIMDFFRSNIQIIKEQINASI